MKRAIFAGTFDPPTNGHLDLVERALELFDGVLIAVASGQHKEPLFSLDERVAMFREVVADRDGVEVVSFAGLLVNVAREHGIRVGVRGLRMVSDFEYEYQMALMNRKLDKGFDTVYLMPSARYTFLNSTVIKEIARYGGSLDGLVPDVVRRQFAAHFGTDGESSGP